MISRSFLFIFFFSVTGLLWASPMQEAKKQAKIIWSEHRETLYCHCPYDKHGRVIYQQCPYQPRNQRRSQYIEWEHIVPASWFGAGRACWNEPLCRTKKGKLYKGRACCEKIDSEFVTMYTDLHNLVPVIGDINRARSAYRFGEFVDNSPPDNPYAACDCAISASDKTMVPSDQDKGLIARVYLYMIYQYGLSIPESDKALYTRWHRDYPPSDWEKRWNERVTHFQKKDNPFVSCYPSGPEGWVWP